MPNIGDLVGNYRLVEVLASGTFGSVYRAEHTLLEQQAAIKFLRSERLDKAEDRKAFLREARLLNKFKHPALLLIVDVGLHNEIPYIMTEYAPNGTLRAYLKRQANQPVALDEALRIMGPISEALQYVHEQHNIVHRDLKPENILFNAQNEPLLADFGIAVQLNDGTTLLSNISGTIPYMAPEQFDGFISHKCDQYALGCILYELLTGQRPFTAACANNIEAMGYQHANVLPIPPRQLNSTLPAHVEAALLKALAKERSERHASVAAFLEALRTEPHTQQTNLLPVELLKAPDVSTQTLQLQPDPDDPTRLIPNNTIILDLPPSDENAPNDPPPTTERDPINSKGTPASEPIPSRTQPAIVWYKRPIAIASTIVLICLLTIGGIQSFAQGGNHPKLSSGQLTLSQPTPSQPTPGQLTPSQPTPSQLTATITITPASRLEQNNYTITAIPNGSIDAAQRQVPARIISVTSATQHATGNATGSIPARAASGALTFFNFNMIGTTLNSTILIGKDGVQVSFQGPVFVPALSDLTVTSFSVNSGTTGNIPAADIYESCCLSGITVQNSSAFTGGLDAIPNSIIRQSDIDGAANPLVTALTQSTQASLQQNIKTNERVVDGTAGCTPAISADQQAGNVTKQVHVSVAVTCHEEVYDATAAQQMAGNLLLEQVQNDPALNAQYAQVGQIVVNVLSASIVGGNNTVNLNIQVQGLWVYQFTAQMQQDIKLKLVKLPLQSAQNVLQQWPGVKQATITLSHGTTMPDNTHDITLTVASLAKSPGNA